MKKYLRDISIVLVAFAILAAAIFVFVPQAKSFPNRIAITYYTPIRLTIFDSPLRAYIVIDNDSGREYLVIPGAGVTLLEK